MTLPDGWTAYYDVNTSTPPERTLVSALDLWEAEHGNHRTSAPFAVDLGCGQGRDTLELLRRGWRVLAIDSDPDAIDRLKRNVSEHDSCRLEVRLDRYEDQSWPQADLINASLTLGWCADGCFPTLWQRIAQSLRSGGRFAGQFHGVNDSGGGFPTTTRLSSEQIEALFISWDIESRKEEEVDSMTPFAIPKHRHLHDIVARRR